MANLHIYNVDTTFRLVGKGLSIKDVRSQGGRRVLQMRTSALFGAKIGIFEIYCVSVRMGVEPVRTKGEGVVNFS